MMQRPSLHLPVRPLVLLAALGIISSACASGGPLPPPPPPHRPPEVPSEDLARDDQPDDCEPMEPTAQPPSLAYEERSIAEAKNLADQGFEMLRRAESGKLPGPEREELVTVAVDRLITALLADPYNVHATYNLAAAYARIDRAQCSVNFLERLALLYKLPSFRAEIDDKLDRLLGRGRYRNNMDPDFHDLRDMDIFREVVRKLQKS